MSKKLEMVFESVEALLIKTPALSQPDEGLKLLSKVEELLSSFPKETNAVFYKLNIDFLTKKASCYLAKGELNTALELALKSLELAEKIEYKINIAFTLQLISIIYAWIGEHKASFDYAIKSLKYMEEIGLQEGVAASLLQIAHAYNSKGDLNKVVEFCKKSLAIQEITKITKINALMLIGATYVSKGELELALDSLKRSVQLAEEISHYGLLPGSLNAIGGLYLTKGNYDKASEYFNRSLKLSQKMSILLHSYISNFYLFWLNLDFIKDFKQALHNLENLKELADQTPEESKFYLLAKALMLKRKKRSRDRAEAEKLLKKIVDGTVEAVSFPQIYIHSLVTLCDFLLEELNESNDPEILDELNPLITRLLKSAENQNSYLHLAEGKLLQAKLALIQMNIEQARLLLAQAQDIAEEHGLQLLARSISKEHDNLLEQLEEWQTLRSRKARFSDRIKLASIDDVISQLQGKRAVEAPEFIDEIPVLLLIIAEGGIPAFSNSFTEDWAAEDGFISNFLTAFNIFSKEIFSQALDRANFGEYKLVMDSIAHFSVCYLFKGQSYAAKQKLIQFAHRVQNTASIWKVLKDFHKTHQTIILRENPPLESLITEIFIKRSL